MKKRHKMEQTLTYEQRQEKEIRQTLVLENQMIGIRNRLIPKLRAALKKYEGKQIILKTGGLLKKVYAELDPICAIEREEGINQKISAYISTTYTYSVYVKITIRYNSENKDGWFYYDNEPYLCGIRAGLLEPLSEYVPQPYYDIEEQVTQYYKVQKLKETLNKEESLLFYKLKKIWFAL